MKWLKKKKKSIWNLNLDQVLPRPLVPYQTSCQPFRSTPAIHDIWSTLSPQILGNIFQFVCPHTQDESYESCEQSSLVDACMLCDLRDLARCAQVCKKWWTVARITLYHSIRIDQVHYCELEAFLAEKRKRKPFMSRNADPQDPAQTRLRLLCRSLRNDKGGIALCVQYLKVPYMARETCKADLACTISVLPNLRYVDLPGGVFTAEASCDTLRLELQARCPDLRKMSYLRGAEKSLEMLIDCNIWRNLEVLELSKLDMDPNLIRYALACLPRLRALKVSEMNSFNDRVLATSNDLMPLVPALAELILEQTPELTADGLISYLSRYDSQQSLKTLSLTSTGITPATLQATLTYAQKLEHLSITESISSPLPVGLPGLKSNTLRTFHFEITPTTAARFSESTVSHYSYLKSSLMSNGLPNLQELYVLDPSFSETLTDLAPPRPNFAFDSDNFYPPNPCSSPTTKRFSTNNPFSPSSMTPRTHSAAVHNPVVSPLTSPSRPRTLEIYSKGLDEMEWNFNRVPTGVNNLRRGSASLPRPTSTYGLSEQADLEWAGAGNDVRKSVIIGDGAGKFLALPMQGDNMKRPSSSAGVRTTERSSTLGNIWR